MDTPNQTQTTIETLPNDFSEFSITCDYKTLDGQFTDKYATAEQKKRDQEITKLLKSYTDNYIAKSKSNRTYKFIIFITSIGILIIFFIMFLSLLYKFKNVNIANNNDIVNNIISLITVCITFLTLVIGILKIITRYVFPQNEEDYITQIVNSIQDNDLANKKANIKSAKNVENNKDKTNNNQHKQDTT